MGSCISVTVGRKHLAEKVLFLWFALSVYSLWQVILSVKHL
jgi:hypothetical protein